MLSVSSLLGVSSAKTPKTVRPNGRSARVLERATVAAIEELREFGSAGFSIPRTARRAGIHAATIYRRWATAEQLVAFAAHAHWQRMLIVPETGSSRENLRAILQRFRVLLEEPSGRLLLAAALEPGAELEAPILSTSSRRSKRPDSFVEKVFSRGETDDPSLTEEMLEVAVGAMYARMCIGRRMATDQFIDNLVTALFVAFGTARAAG